MTEAIARLERAYNLLDQGRPNEAHVLFTDSVALAPHNPVGYLGLAKACEVLGLAGEAVKAYSDALALDMHLTYAHLRLAELLLARNDFGAALTHIEAAYKPVHAHITPYIGGSEPIRVLQLGSAVAEGHTSSAPFLTDDLFETTTIAVQYWERARPFPAHNVIFNAIADPDVNAPALDIAEWMIATSNAPVINAPSSIRHTGRATNAQRLRAIPGVIAPRVCAFSRGKLENPDAATHLHKHDFRFPLLLRSPGHHNGEHFAYIAAADDLPPALRDLPGTTILAIEYLESRTHDEKFRKYRAMFIDGTIYPAHLAVSKNWNVHYFSAQMDDTARAEEMRYLSDMPNALGERVMHTLRRIAAVLNLDYAGIDFGIDANDNVIVFEANAAMTVFLPEDNPEAQYRRNAVFRIYSAAQQMVIKRLSR